MNAIITKPWYLSKTLWLNVIGFLVFLVTYFMDNQMFPTWITWEALALAVLNFLLRLITNTQVTK
jgi:hypothetical protein